MSQTSVVLFISPESYLYACEVFEDFLHKHALSLLVLIGYQGTDLFAL